MRSHLAVALGIGMAFADTAAHAGAFLIPETHARATGRGSAVTATVTDGSAAYYNPGGLGFANTWRVDVGAALVVPDSAFTNDATGLKTNGNDDVSVIPNFYVAGPADDVFRVGLGFNVPFGSSVGWPASSPGADEIREVTLRAAFISPVVGMNLGRWIPGLAIGGGVDLVPASVELRRDIFFGQDMGTVRLGGNGIGLGGRAGLMYQPPKLPQVSVGVAYRSEVAINFDGDANFDAMAPYRSTLPPDGQVQTSITLPQSVLLGFAVRPLPQLEVELDLNWIGWSSFDTLDILLPDGTHSISPQNYRDVWTLRAGAEYKFPRQGVAVRAGYVFDPTPIPDDHLTMLLPDIDRHVLTAGASYAYPALGARVDLGLLWVLPGNNRTADTPYEPILKGKFDVSAFLVGLNLSYAFGGGASL